VSKSGSGALAAFDDTKPQREEALLQLAATALRAGIPLDASRAERCWREEQARPVVRETCVLLWAGRGDNSPELENAILSGPSRILSLALLQRRPSVARLSWPELLARMDALAQDPLWARADLAGAWLEAHGNPGLAESERLLPRIRPPAGAGPRDLASSLRAIRRLRAGAWQETLGNYCDPAASGESRLRCWKVLGALGTEGGLLAPLLPSPNEDDWRLFTLSFPRFAEKLRAYLR
jgi:hypothetical protein